MAYVLRQAAHDEEFKWIGEKFIIITREKTVYLRIKQLKFTIPTKEPELLTQPQLEEDHYPEADLIYIANKLLTKKPAKIRFINTKIGDDDIEKLKLLALRLRYNLSIDNDTITLDQYAYITEQGQENSGDMGG